MTLEGKVAVVTGASRGIGRAIAGALAERGARVVCTATRDGGCAATVDEIRAAGGEAHGYALEVSSLEAVDGFAKAVTDDVGPVSVLVNNAGITRDGLFLRMAAEDFDAVLAVNLRGAFATCRAFARGMAKARHGRIVNVGSVVGLTGNAGQVNYAAAKAGLIGMSKSLARELAGRGVTVNVVAPGFIETDMTAGLPEDVRTEAVKNIPLARFGTPSDVAGTVSFLCSDAAAYLTGQVLVVDGGMAM